MKTWNSPVLGGAFSDEIASLAMASTREQQEAVAGRVFGNLGVDFFRLIWHRTSGLATQDSITLTNCPASWTARYQELGLHEIDPKLDRSLRSVTPTLWDLSRLPADMGIKERHYWMAFLEVGLDFMVTIPLRGVQSFSMLCVSFPRGNTRATALQEIFPSIYAFAPYLHEALDRIEGNSAAVPNLTQRELQCVTWAAEGKTAWETSQILRISERTVHFHLHNVMRKLGTSNKMHAVSRAQRLSLLPNYGTREFRNDSSDSSLRRAPTSRDPKL